MTSAGNDNVFEWAAIANTKLYQVSDASGGLEVTPVEGTLLLQDMLDINVYFILNCLSEVFAWVARAPLALSTRS